MFYRQWRNNRPRGSKYDIAETDDDSILLTVYTLGVDIQKVSDGHLEGLHYNLLLTTDLPKYEKEVYVGGVVGTIEKPVSAEPLPVDMRRAPAGKIILGLDLPTKSQVHILGFTANDQNLPKLLENTRLDNRMTKVQLEGDFPDFFKLYCTTGREIELREVLDPTRMAFLIDFCSTFNFELVGNNVYFVQSDIEGQTANLPMIKAAEEFTQKVLPVLQRMSGIESSAT